MLGLRQKLTYYTPMWLTKKRVLEILERGHAHDRVSLFIDRFLAVLIVLNIFAVCLESVGHISTAYAQQFMIFELFSVSIFSVEYVLRIWANGVRVESKRKTPLGRRLDYIFSFNGIVDFLAIAPSFVSLFLGSVDLRWLRAVRLLRILKLSNYSSAVEDLFSAIRDEMRSFGAALYLFSIALFLASAAMYIAERDAQPEVFSSIPETMWWALITLATVGYGDVTPITAMGKIIGAFTAMLGVSTVALLTGIIANSFVNQMNKRKEIFAAQITHALSDGIISETEGEKIEALRCRFNLSEEYARAIIETLQDRQK